MSPEELEKLGRLASSKRFADFPLTNLREDATFEEVEGCILSLSDEFEILHRTIIELTNH